MIFTFIILTIIHKKVQIIELLELKKLQKFKKKKSTINFQAYNILLYAFDCKNI